MESWTPESVAQKALKGAVALGARQVLVQGANVLGSALLARLLTPAEFGLYAVVIFLLSFLVVFGSTGLAANLIRQPEEPTREDYQAVFTLQLVVVLTIALLLWITAPWIAQAYGLPSQDAWLFRLVALSLFITSFMVIPQVRLERRLSFDRLALAEVAQALVFNTSAVLLAWREVGALSFALALLLRALTGAVLANLLEPWRLGWRWEWSRARNHLRFATYFQGAQFISLVKDSIAPVFVGLLLGAAQVGHLSWAAMVANYPVFALMVLTRVYMPAFSRMQQHREQLARFVERVVAATNALTAPLTVFTLILVEPLTRLVFGEKWLVALPLFYLFWAANLFVPTASPLIGLLNALGNARAAFWFGVLWMVGTWVLGVPLIVGYGAVGLAVANLAVNFANLWLYRVAQREVAFRILPVVLPSWALAFGVGGALYLVQGVWPVESLPVLLAFGVLGCIFYVFGLSLGYPGEARKFAAMLRRSR
jgi:O-antigen/teichoic acid export membrane protein